MTARHRATAFGILWNADLPLPEFTDADGAEPCAPLGHVEIRRASAAAERSPVRLVNRGMVCRDGIRLEWNGEVLFDMFDGKRIDYVPGEHWRATLPPSFYSTIAALTLAWRGAVPLHGSAVDVGGRAFLIAGPGGAGKSTLAAGLIALGATFIADDLTVVRVQKGGNQVDVFPGRPAIRQHAASATLGTAGARIAAEADARGKLLVRPSMQASRTLELSGMLLLDTGRGPKDAAERIALLAQNLFRPRWTAALPNHAAIRRDLLTIASIVPMRTFPAIDSFDPLYEIRRAEQAMAALGAMAAR